MERTISKSVGENGTNFKNDVTTVQELLNGVSPEKGGPSPKLDVDGLVGPKTIGAIKHFQKVACEFKFPDGRVDPGQKTITKLNELNSEPGDDRFVGFTSERRKIVQEDIKVAKQRANACQSSLLPSFRFPRDDQFGRQLPIPPAGIDPEISSLLQDTFDIDGSDFNQVIRIQQRYQLFGGRMETVRFIFSSDHAPDRHVAFVKVPVFGPTPNEIHITESYFSREMGAGNFPVVSNQFARALTLIHEFIHLFNEGQGHPGGQPIAFQRTRLDIPFANAVFNAWCYESYAKWLRN